MAHPPQRAPGVDAELQACCAARAWEYEALYCKPERQADLLAVQSWLVPQFGGARVLEVASGTGYWTQCIAATAASVLGLGAAQETSQVARTRGLGRERALGTARCVRAARHARSL